jgi:hypothetical protein
MVRMPSWSHNLAIVRIYNVVQRRGATAPASSQDSFAAAASSVVAFFYAAGPNRHRGISDGHPQRLTGAAFFLILETQG